MNEKILRQVLIAFFIVLVLVIGLAIYSVWSRPAPKDERLVQPSGNNTPAVLPTPATPQTPATRPTR